MLCDLYILSGNNEASVTIHTAHSSTSFILPPLTLYTQQYNATFLPEVEQETKAIRVTSDVHLQVLMYKVTDVYDEIYQVPSLHRAGNVYYTAADNRNECGAAGYWKQFYLITSFYDDTTVTVTFQDGRMKTVNLPEFGTYTEVTSSNSDRLASGTKVTSSKPVNVVWGNPCRWNATEGALAGSYVSSIPAKHILGRKYVIPRILPPEDSTPAGFYVQVTATEDDTVVNVDGHLVKVIDEGEIVEHDFVNEMVFITCSTDCLVVQFSKAATFSSHRIFMQHILPTEDFMTSTYFSTVDNKDQSPYLSIVVQGKTNGNDLLLNGTSLGHLEWNYLNGYCTSELLIEPGVYMLESTEGRLFAAYVYSHDSSPRGGSAYAVLPTA